MAWLHLMHICAGHRPRAHIILVAEEHRSRWGARPSKPLRRDYVPGGFDSYLFRQYLNKINSLQVTIDFTPDKTP